MNMLRAGFLVLAMAITGVSGLSGVDGTVAGGSAPTGVSVTMRHLDESGLMSAVAEAASSNCFADTIRIGGMETCQFAYWQLVCTRMRNNYPSNVLESSYKFQHISVTTTAGMAQLKSVAAPATPTKKAMGRDGDDSSGSYTAMARTLAMPLATETIFSIAQGVTFGNLCRPNVTGLGYIYLSDADEDARGRSNWRATISPYYLHGITAPITGLAKALELTGLCGLDFTHFLCYGGYGTVWPISGQNPAASPMMNLLITAWRAQEIHAPAWPEHGIWGTSLGPMVWQLHSPRAFAYGVTAQIPKYSPGGYVQWLYPGSSGTGTADKSCYPIGFQAGSLQPFATQMLSETFNRIPLQDMVLSFVYWSRWTCCNYCQLSNETAGRQMQADKSFRPTLTRRSR